MTDTKATIDTVKIGTQFKVKSGKVYEAIGGPGTGLPGPGISTSGNGFCCYAVQIKDGRQYGPFRLLFAKSIVEIL